jgi:hypothetical protein
VSGVQFPPWPPFHHPATSVDGGLFLLVNPSGSRWWRFKFRVHGRENLLSLGVFPEVPLREARELRDEARRDLRKGTDPAAKRRTARMAGGETFKAIAQEWFDKFSPNWAQSYVCGSIADFGIELLDRTEHLNQVSWRLESGRTLAGTMPSSRVRIFLSRKNQRLGVHSGTQARDSCGTAVRKSYATVPPKSAPPRPQRGVLVRFELARTNSQKAFSSIVPAASSRTAWAAASSLAVKR